MKYRQRNYIHYSRYYFWIHWYYRTTSLIELPQLIYFYQSLSSKTRSLTKPALRHTKTVAYTLVCLNMYIT